MERIFMVHPTFRVITPKNRKKATVLFVYLNIDQQMYKDEQQLSISCLGSV